ncbi:MAG: NAD(P)H-dependent oxidoreductase subunit E [Rikenellaceae bacterium]
MERKLVVKICTGTLCYVMGGAELQALDEHLSEEIQEQLDIIGAPCLEHCNCCEENEEPKAPFVEVGDKVIAKASIEKVVAAIKEELGIE